MDGDAESSREEESPRANEPGEPRRSRLSRRLRTAAFVLLIVGFGGALATDTAPTSLASVYSYVFFAGVACAIASVYLGIFQQGAGE